ncbi:hypothetical protein LMF32_00175 [Desemzia sp. C1]|uniref:hypothetical protein n=1 Tax=Desemzia sp. C1 TaxID=2892016 RepID=UPI001E41DB5A|nr:hypothetical protein [Desemzia sp. C1]MCI3027552.1 hypothetical protein [Desemzia sp. C1]
MKKIIVLFFTIFSFFILSGCSSFGNSVHEELQSTNWNVVSTKGDAYSADFGESTVTFDLAGFPFGYSYSLNEEESKIVFQSSEEDVNIEYNIEKENDEFVLTATTEESREENGNLTLTPIEQQ